jgi:hypothetical protein
MDSPDDHLCDQLIEIIFEKIEDDKIMRILYGKRFKSKYDTKIKAILAALKGSGYQIIHRDDEFPKVMKNGINHTEKALLKHLNN